MSEDSKTIIELARRMFAEIDAEGYISKDTCELINQFEIEFEAFFDAPSPDANLRAIEWYLKRIKEEIEAGRTQNALSYVSFAAAEYSTKAKMPLSSDYERGVRDGVEEAINIASDQARLMADLAIEGLPENSREREAMEAALTRFADKLCVTLDSLATRTPSAVEALQAIADLETPESLDRMNGHEDAYRAVNKLFD